MANFDLQKTIPVLERSLAFFQPHHQELRRRVTIILVSIVCCTVGAYFFSEQIAAFFIQPLFDASPLIYRLVYTNLPEAFIAYIKLALLIGLMASMPITLYQLWTFISPGLHKDEKSIAVSVLFWSILLFFSGGCFAFWVVIPKLLEYFMSYGSEALIPTPRLSGYLTFIARSILAFGLSFQIPFLMVMAGKASIFSASHFKSKRTYFYIAILVLSFLLAAGDFMATILLAIPLFLLYETGIVLSQIFNRKK